MKFEIKILFGIAVVTSISYSIINAFFAPIVIQKNVDESTLGMIISMFPFVIILITPFISYFVETFGRKFLFVNSLLSQVIFTVLYGIIPYIEDSYVFTYACFALRISHGIASAFNINLLISTAAKLSNRDEVNSNFAMIDLGWMFGKFCGPTIISLIYSYGGVFYTFLFSAATLLICYFCASQYINLEDEEIKPDEIKENFFTSLEKYDIFILFFSQFLNMLSKTYSGPILFTHINKRFNITLEQASNMLSLSFISYYLTIYYIDNIIKRFGTKLTIAFGVFLNFVSVNLLYPVRILPQTAMLISLGFFLLGFPSGCIDIPIMVDLKTTFQDKYNYPDHLANDITSSIYTFANQLGESLGPMYGGYITHNYSFEFACIFTGLINLGFFLFFIYIYSKHMTINEMVSEEEDEYNANYLSCNDIEKENTAASEIELIAEVETNGQNSPCEKVNDNLPPCCQAKHKIN